MNTEKSNASEASPGAQSASPRDAARRSWRTECAVPAYKAVAVVVAITLLAGGAASSLAPPSVGGPLLLCAIFTAVGLIAAVPITLHALGPLFTQVEQALAHVRDAHRGQADEERRAVAPVGIGDAVGSALCDLRAKARLVGSDAERAQKLVSRLINAHEASRKQLASQLKDGAGELVSALAMGLYRLGNALDRPESAREELSHLKRQTARTVARLRQVVLELSPALLDDLGLVAAARWYVLEKVEIAGIRALFQAPGLERRRFPPAVELGVFRIIEEALRNVLQHSGATEVRVELALRDGYLLATVTDDGKGFDVNAEPSSDQATGILALEQRAALIGGKLSITSEPGRTCVAVDVPVPAT